MAIRHRHMRPGDVGKCVNIVAAHPIVGRRYGSAITDLGLAWLRVLGREAFMSVVFEELSGSDVRLLGAGVTAFVSEDFIRQLKTPPFFWIGPELARRIVRGACPLLSDQELRDANSGAGLNLVVWQIGILPQDLKRADITSEAMTAFISLHRGFLLKELIAQPETAEHLHGLRNAGGLLMKPDGSYGDFDETEARDFLSEPCNIGGTREMILKELVSWSFPLFVYQPPKCGFSRSEQRLMLLAFDAGTDGELAERLQVSVSAVKKMWHSIYDRVDECLPELLPHRVSGAYGSERGKEKKQRLLAYLRDHPEELRPVSRRLLKARRFGTPTTHSKTRLRD